MRQFRISQALESMAWLSLGIAVFKAYLSVIASNHNTLAFRQWEIGVVLLLWLIGGVSLGNVFAAFSGRRIVWSIIGVCWMPFVVLGLHEMGMIKGFR
jgi:hypothetical protein